MLIVQVMELPAGGGANPRHADYDSGIPPLRKATTAAAQLQFGPTL